MNLQAWHASTGQHFGGHQAGRAATDNGDAQAWSGGGLERTGGGGSEVVQWVSEGDVAAGYQYTCNTIVLIASGACPAWKKSENSSKNQPDGQFRICGDR